MYVQKQKNGSLYNKSLTCSEIEKAIFTALYLVENDGHISFP